MGVKKIESWKGKTWPMFIMKIAQGWTSLCDLTGDYSPNISLVITV